MYLLDTNVLSEMRRARPHGGVLAWLRTVEPSILYLPSVVAGEIQIGIERTYASDPEKAAELMSWLENLLRVSNVIAADAEIFRIWARLVRTVDGTLLIDALIAATAIRYGMTVVTRNIRDFQNFPVSVLNPFEHKS